MKFRIFLFSGITLFLGILCMFSWSAYSYYQMIHADDPVTPSLSVVEGEAKIIRGDYAIELVKDETYNLEANDAIETAKNSIATVTWPDHSVTRLGSNTRIVIQKMIADAGYENIQISFSLKKGKIWSTVVRALIGDSYFETKLPKNDIVAGVRGTIFEINLDDKYIHAVNHAVTLTDSSQKNVTLMPGEVVDSENIWITRGKEILDNAWAQANTLYDATYIQERVTSLKLSLSDNANILVKKYDQLVRWILEHFRAFQALSVSELLNANNVTELAKYPQEILTTYYQRIQGISTPEARDSLRNALYEKSLLSGSGMENILNTLRVGAIWETLESGEILPGAQKILDAGSSKVGENLNTIKTLLMEKNFTEEARKILNTIPTLKP
ncbi:MAG: FecR family protein [Candidatus Gracilibacteria bacterium]|nr:FecR family protein [Candidatus Gracilibacteria bacterium]